MQSQIPSLLPFPSQPTQLSNQSTQPPSTVVPISIPSLHTIRELLSKYMGKVMNKEINRFAFQKCLTFLSFHPTWKNRLEDIDCLRVIKSKLNSACTLQMKTNRSKNYFTISWRKCVPKKALHSNVKQGDAQPTASDKDNKYDDGKDCGDDDGYKREEEKDKSESASDCIKKQLKHLHGAMRSAIRSQITTFKKEHRINRHCAQCKQTTRLHVDHKAPAFRDIRENFLDQVALIDIPDEFDFNRRCIPKFKTSNRKFSTSWKKFHKDHASLQWLCTTCNLKKGCKQ